MPQGFQKAQIRQKFPRESGANFHWKFHWNVFLNKNAKFPHFSPEHFRFRFRLNQTPKIAHGTPDEIHKGPIAARNDITRLVYNWPVPGVAPAG